MRAKEDISGLKQKKVIEISDLTMLEENCMERFAAEPSQHVNWLTGTQPSP